ncbi:MAG: hypothetical protein ACTSPB_00145 [Candidatus Thorarchaeota archaeon]
MVKEFLSSEGVMIDSRHVCPDCKEHEQMEFREVQRRFREDDGEECDCKNLFLSDEGEVLGQCCCFSKKHTYEGVV